MKKEPNQPPWLITERWAKKSFAQVSLLPMRVIRILAALALLLDLDARAQTKPAMSIHTAMMEATCKIVGPGSIGSGFILGTPDPKNPEFSYFTLVTAHHVLEGIKGDSAILVLRNVVNRQKQEYQLLEVPIQIRKGGSLLWTKHPDVDLAAMFVALPKDASNTFIPASLLITDDSIKEFELSSGTELICLGYPFGDESTPLGFPILRSGRIASFPLLPTSVTKTFLFDFTVFRGNSGGPVYLYQTNPVYGGGTHIGAIQGVMGVVTSERKITQKIEQLYERRETDTPLVLGEVIHASFIKDLVSKLPIPSAPR